jgi:mono/diheme cytochrome c family protein
MGLIPVANADDQRASVNYMIHCQGCHLPEAVGFAGKVPRMKDFVGYFLHSKEGREFVIRVPGVATSSLADDELTEMMNWLLLTYSADQLPKPFVPFSTEEVAALRPDLEANPEKTRMRILGKIAQDLASLAVELEQDSGG